jgi:rubrerythrin
MLSQEPIDLSKVKEEDVDKEILRLGMIAELDAVNLYEQLAAKTKNKKIKAVLLDIAKEEKTHVGEFQTLLLELDKEQVEELEKGKQEVTELKKIK